VLLSLSTTLVLTFFFHHWFSSKARQYHAEQRATEAQLKLLQAQIEPHFLFNTLANVQSLMDHDLPRARQMLGSFTDYLRASLGTLRRDDSAVADELELARSYLELLQARMDDRLRFSIDADEAARTLPLPPLLLQPLVENAVVHGLEPSIDGGSVTVTARVRGDRLVLEVRDDGRGPDAPPSGARRGNGVALQNIRERLFTRYGEQARLSIEPAHPGTCARIELPLAGSAA
jgi:sensor histidine kinase YesM